MTTVEHPSSYQHVHEKSLKSHCKESKKWRKNTKKIATGYFSRRQKNSEFNGNWEKKKKSTKIYEKTWHRMNISRIFFLSRIRKKWNNEIAMMLKAVLQQHDFIVYSWNKYIKTASRLYSTNAYIVVYRTCIKTKQKLYKQNRVKINNTKQKKYTYEL